MKNSRSSAWLCAALAVAALAAACGALLPKSQSAPARFGLAEVSAARAEGPARADGPVPPGLVLLVESPHADAGFDSARIVYIGADGRLAHFAHSEWVDTPARLLAPLIVSTLASGGAFRAVVAAPSAAAGDLRLETQIIRLQQDFGASPSRVRFTLRGTLILEGSRDVVVSREFDAVVVAGQADAAGGVSAARQAVAEVLGQLRTFCADSAAALPPRSASR